MTRTINLSDTPSISTVLKRPNPSNNATRYRSNYHQYSTQIKECGYRFKRGISKDLKCMADSMEFNEFFRYVLVNDLIYDIDKPKTIRSSHRNLDKVTLSNIYA